MALKADEDAEEGAAAKEEDDDEDADEDDETSSDGAPSPPPAKRAEIEKPKTLSYPQAARNLFQHAEVKQMLRAALGDKMQEVNAAACLKVEELERQEAEARLEKARAIPFENEGVELCSQEEVWQTLD